MQTGDVLLVSGRGKTSKYLIFFQKIFYWNTRSSHILLGITDGIFIEATPNGGVNICLMHDVLKTVKNNWRIIRFKKITPDHQENIIKSAIYFYQQGYNFKLIGTPQKNRSFCSELVVKIFNRTGIPIFGKKLPSAIKPAMFDREANKNGDWEDVTSEYQKILLDIFENETIYRYGIETLRLRLTKRKIMNPIADSLFKEAFDKLSEASQKEFEKLYGGLDVIKQKRNLNFWDQD